MAVLTHLETDTGTNVDISGATAVGAYTANADKLVMCDVSIDAVAGNGDYVMYVTRQIGGSGSAYRILPQTTMAAASGLTAISAQSGWITVRNGDVLTVYIDGLAGDTSTPDWTTRWFELAGVTAAAVADAVLDEATSGHTSAGSFSKAVTDILADTGTDGVVVASIANDALTAAAVKADAVTKIQNGLALEATLTAIKGAGWSTETLKVIRDALTAAQADLDNPSQYKADVSGLMTAGAYTAPDNAGIAAIESKTNNLPASPAPANEYDARMTAIQADLDNPAQYKADVSGLATTAHVQEVEDKVDIVDGIADAILDDTGTTGVLLSTSALGSIFDDEVIVGTYTFSDLLKIMAAALAGKLSGGGSTTLKFEGVDGASDVIVTTVDANKNRTNVTLTV